MLDRPHHTGDCPPRGGKHHRPSQASPFPPRLMRINLHIHYHPETIVSKAQLSFIDPIARTDGTALSPDEIASIDIFDSASATPDVAIGSVSGAGVTFLTDVLSVGPHVFTARVNDTTGHRSAQSDPAPLDVPATLANPNPVTGLAATLVE